MGIMVSSLLWGMQHLYHQAYFGGLSAYVGLGSNPRTVPAPGQGNAKHTFTCPWLVTA